MTEEIPRKVVFVILLVAIVLSLLGTWITLDALNSKDDVVYYATPSAGKVGLVILEPENIEEQGESNTNGWGFK